MFVFIKVFTRLEILKKFASFVKRGPVLVDSEFKLEV